MMLYSGLHDRRHTMRIVFYRRVSTEEQGQSGNGLEAQLKALQGFAASGGHEVLGEFCDVVSGSADILERLGLRRALALAKRLGASVVVSKLDRLSRSVAFISAMMEQGVQFFTVENGPQCPPFVLHVLAAAAEEERRNIRLRTRLALQAKKARGEALGYRTHKNPGATLAKAQEAAREAMTRIATDKAKSVAPMLKAFRSQGQTMAQVAQSMNEQGIPTARGGKWHASTVCNALARAGS
jgi:DNA invertase Pin-like site-specific DNA recombinase